MVILSAVTIGTGYELGELRRLEQEAGNAEVDDLNGEPTDEVSELAPPEGAPLRSANALLPLGLLVLGALAGCCHNIGTVMGYSQLQQSAEKSHTTAQSPLAPPHSLCVLPIVSSSTLLAKPVCTDTTQALQYSVETLIE